MHLYRLIALLAFVTLLVSCGGGGGGSTSSLATGFSINGMVVAAKGTAIDSDVNDPFAPFSDNSSFDTAQPLRNPVTLAGYVNVLLEGEAGRSFLAGDSADVFEVDLEAGQVISLSFVEDTASNDLDLGLYDSDRNLVGGSTSVQSPTEQLIAPSEGRFFIRVVAFSGFSNYILTIGQEVADASAGVIPPHVPGELVVRFDESLAAPLSAQARAASLGLQSVAGGPGGPQLFSLGDTDNRVAALSALGVSADPHSEELPESSRQTYDTLLALKALQRRPDVLTADLNYLFQPTLIPDDEYYDLQWHYPLINLPQAWDLVPADSSVVVAVVDTGIVDHPDLDPRRVQGYDFIADPARAGDGNGIDDNPNDEGDGQFPGSSSYHGTHVAGTVAAASDNGIGIAGVAINSRIMPLRALGQGGGTSYDLIQSVRYAAGLSNDSGTVPTQPADVINLSLGGGGFSAADQATFQAVRDAGVIVVAAAGNAATSTPSYPAAYDSVISVSAVDQEQNLAPYSNFGNTISVAAPGGNSAADLNGDGYQDGVLSTLVDVRPNGTVQPGYSFLQGTSMASPHVAGVLGMMRSIDADLTPNEVDALLSQGELTNDIGAAGYDNQFGFGLIDAFKAVTAAIELSGGGEPVDAQPVLVASPQSLNLGVSQTTASIQLRNGGGDTLLVDPAIIDDGGEGWLAIQNVEVDNEGLGFYRVVIDRNGLAEGTYQGSVQFDSSANSVAIPVIMQVAAAGANDQGNVGFHWMILLDPISSETIMTTNSGVRDGEYPFSFSGVVEGGYTLLAGTDLDNDGIICDAGEACGGFPTLDQPEVISVTSDLFGLDFLSNFSSTLFSLGSGSSQSGFSKQPIHKSAAP